MSKIDTFEKMQLNFKICAYSLILGAFYILSNAELPGYIKVCSRNDSQLAKCINNSVYVLLPRLRQGIPELDIPALEPLTLKAITLNRGPEGAKIDANITNVKVWGPSSFQILDLRANSHKNIFRFRVNVPRLHFEGDYEMDMRLLFVELHGKGPVNGNITNYMFNCVMRGHIIQKNGEEYLEFDKMELDINVGKGSIYLGNLFNGDPVLGRATNEAINENADILLNEIKPSLQEGLSSTFTEIANKISLVFRYKDLFP